VRFGANARLGLQQGDDVGELIERARQVLYDRSPTVAMVSMTVPEPEDQVPRAPKPRALRLPHLRAWRSRRGWDQAQLAEAAGVARETIGRMEHGRAGRRDVILSLADALDVAPSELTGTADLDALTGLEYQMCKGCRARRRARCFVRVRGTPYLYLRCRMCRAARARERYHASADERAKQLARAQRNYRRRKQPADQTSE
jgi:DNA-binding XRE family transcriptional regulator